MPTGKKKGIGKMKKKISKVINGFMVAATSVTTVGGVLATVPVQAAEPTNQTRNSGDYMVNKGVVDFGEGTSNITIKGNPVISSMMSRQQLKNTISSYKSSVSQESKNDLESELEKAQKYNSMLFQASGAIIEDLDSSILSDKSYDSLLSQGDSGIMGSIEIPKIDVDLPIYHGTSDEVLSNGVGHQQGTSLPVGGDNTHCVLTGHRGLPGSKLFTRLDEMEKDDLFYISVCGKILAYQVYDIQVVDPDNTDVMKILPDEDTVSLVTCTPYGLNTHRLVVTGKRVPYKKAQYKSIEQNIPSIREIIFTALPIVLIVILLIWKIKDWRRKAL